MASQPFHVEAAPTSFVEIPAAGTISRTLHDDGEIRVVVFGFAEGEQLTEHTSSRPAVIQVLRGRLDLVLDGQDVSAGEGAWIHMGAGLRHAVRARTASVMLLTLLARPEGPPSAP